MGIVSLRWDPGVVAHAKVSPNHVRSVGLLVHSQRLAIVHWVSRIRACDCSREPTSNRGSILDEAVVYQQSDEGRSNVDVRSPLLLLTLDSQMSHFPKHLGCHWSDVAKCRHHKWEELNVQVFQGPLAVHCNAAPEPLLLLSHSLCIHLELPPLSASQDGIQMVLFRDGRDP